MIKRYSTNLDFDLYINAAEKLKLKTRILKKGRPIGVIYNNKKKLFIFYNQISVYNPFRIFHNSKNIQYQFFKFYKIPYPKSILLNLKKNHIGKFKPFIRNLKKPLVVKPCSGTCSKGVYVNVSSDKEILKAINYSAKYGKKIIIQEYIKGENYRIIFLKNKIIDVIRRERANLIGNGKDKIKTLIRKKNKIRYRLNLSLIKTNEELMESLEKQGYDLSSILKKDLKIHIYREGNSSQEECKRIKIEDVHKDNIDMFTRICTLMGFTLAGIDFISPDISKSYKKIKSGINEINSSPMTQIDYSADMKMDNFVAEEILGDFFNL